MKGKGIIDRIGFSRRIFNPFEEFHEGLYYTQPKGTLDVDNEGWIFIAAIIPNEPLAIRFTVSSPEGVLRKTRPAAIFGRDNEDIVILWKNNRYATCFRDDYNSEIGLAERYLYSERFTRVYLFIRVGEISEHPYELEIKTRLLDNTEITHDSVKIRVSQKDPENSKKVLDLSKWTKLDMITYITNGSGFANKETLTKLVQEINENMYYKVNPYRGD